HRRAREPQKGMGFATSGADGAVAFDGPQEKNRGCVEFADTHHRAGLSGENVGEHASVAVFFSQAFCVAKQAVSGFSGLQANIAEVDESLDEQTHAFAWAEVANGVLPEF